jgi:type I restriction enzyme R subunit
VPSRTTGAEAGAFLGDPASTKTIDLGLFVNGIPVATAELKTHLTNQTADDAIKQYRADRDPKNALLRRAIVHFAVDTEQVFMTTKLAGNATRFLPFNREQRLIRPRERPRLC